MSRFFTFVGDTVVVAGPFVTYCQAQGAGVKYARENGIPQHKMTVKEV